MNSPKKFKWLFLVLIGVLVGILPSLVSAQEELFVSALDETGSTYVAQKDGTYRFMIVGGAYTVWTADEPNNEGWKTEILCFKNRPVE